MTASDIDRLREMGLLPECWSCHGAGKHPQFASDSDGGTCRVCKGTGYDDSSEALAAVAVEQHERAESWKSRYGIQGKSYVNCQYDYEQEKARADTAQANLEVCATSLHLAEFRADRAEAMLTVAFDTYQAGVENGGYWEHCTYTQWLADLARRSQENP